MDLEYKTVFAKGSEDFDKVVNDLLRQGWQLFGHPYANGQYQMQALIKADRKNPTDAPSVFPIAL